MLLKVSRNENLVHEQKTNVPNNEPTTKHKNKAITLHLIPRIFVSKLNILMADPDIYYTYLLDKNILINLINFYKLVKLKISLHKIIAGIPTTKLVIKKPIAIIAIA